MYALHHGRCTGASRIWIYGGQVERQRRREFMGWVMGGGILLLIRRGLGSAPSGIFSFLRLEVHILAHYAANLRLTVCFCAVIRPGPDLQYACPV